MTPPGTPSSAARVRRAGWDRKGLLVIDELELDDASLVQAAQMGDREAFTELFRRHYPTVRRVCARRMGNLAEADEVAQAAFVRAYERIDQCVGERRFGAWVQVIAYRLGADARRLQARSMPTDEPVMFDAVLGPNHCEDALLAAEQSAQVHEALATLPPRQRQVIIARDLEGRRPAEIAASLGLSLGAVDSLLLRARRRMAKAWRSACPEAGATTAPVLGASLAAAAGVAAGAAGAGVGPIGWVLSRFDRTVDSLSYRLASRLGMIAGEPLSSRAGGLALAGLLIAAPVTGAVAFGSIAGVGPGSGAARPGQVGGPVPGHRPRAGVASEAVLTAAGSPAAGGPAGGRARSGADAWGSTVPPSSGPGGDRLAPGVAAWRAVDKTAGRVVGGVVTGVGGTLGGLDTVPAAAPVHPGAAGGATPGGRAQDGLVPTVGGVARAVGGLVSGVAGAAGTSPGPGSGGG